MDEKGIGPDVFKDLMSAVASTVTVVTAGGVDGPIGMTVSAFTSVSVDPPIVLACIDKAVGSLPGYLTADGFTVNFLPESAEAEATLFATKGADRFGSVPWKGPSVSEAGPILDIAFGNFQCVTVEQVEMGDHWVIFGRVDAGGRTSSGVLPLLHVERHYAAVAERTPDA